MIRISCLIGLLSLTTGMSACAPPPSEGEGLETISNAIQIDSALQSPFFGHDISGDVQGCPPGCLDESGLLRDNSLQAPGRLREILVWSGKYIDGIELIWQDINNPRQLIRSPHVGGFGGELRRFALQSDEAIVAVEGRSGKFVDFLQITTNKGRVMSWGGSGGGRFVVPLPEGDEVHGIRTVSNKLIDAIAFWSYLP